MKDDELEINYGTGTVQAYFIYGPIFVKIYIKWYIIFFYFFSTRFFLQLGMFCTVRENDVLSRIFVQKYHVDDAVTQDSIINMVHRDAVKDSFFDEALLLISDVAVRF